MSKHWSADLRRLDACHDALLYAEKHETLEAAWAGCERGDWMLWLLAKCRARREDVVLAACSCARLAPPCIPRGEEGPLRAIETAESWARGDGATLGEVKAAANAYAHATATATATTTTTGAAAYAYAYAYAYAVAYAVAYARRETLAECADLVRERFPSPPALKALNEVQP